MLVGRNWVACSVRDGNYMFSVQERGYSALNISRASLFGVVLRRMQGNPVGLRKCQIARQAMFSDMPYRQQFAQQTPQAA
jgi:hypothetical protein